MSKLYGAAAALVLVWSVSMSFFALSAYSADWVWGVVGGGVLVVFLAAGGALIPPARRDVPEKDRKVSFWFMQFFGAFITAELLTAALIAWIMGNRSHVDNTGYQVLGIFVFLGFLGLGLQGALATLSIFLRQRNLQVIEERRFARPALHH